MQACERGSAGRASFKTDRVDGGQKAYWVRTCIGVDLAYRPILAVHFSLHIPASECGVHCRGIDPNRDRCGQKNANSFTPNLRGFSSEFV